jgi:hypothetical protein
MNYLERQQAWVEKHNRWVARKQKAKHDKEAAECTFSPQLSEASKAVVRRHRSTVSRTARVSVRVVVPPLHHRRRAATPRARWHSHFCWCCLQFCEARRRCAACGLQRGRAACGHTARCYRPPHMPPERAVSHLCVCAQSPTTASIMRAQKAESAKGARVCCAPL